FLRGINGRPRKMARPGQWAISPRLKRNLTNQRFGREPGPEQQSLRRRQRRAASLTLAFVALCVLVAVGATQSVDRWVQVRANALASYPFDVTTSLVTTLGGPEITGVITFLWSFMWWRRKGIRGLLPLLLFVGVGIELVLKYYLPQPGPPSELARGFH